MRRWFGRSPAPVEVSDDVGTIGYLDTVEAGQVRGWAYSPQQPDRRVRVRVLVDGRPTAEDAADQYRADLAALGQGDGRHGFAVALPATLLDGRARVVEAVDAETGVRLRALARRHRLTRDRDPVQAALDRLFDPGHYETQAGRTPFALDHYRETGWRQGFDPHPLFSTAHYLTHNRVDGRPIAGDPLTHFAEVGQFAGAWTHPLLDPRAAPAAARREGERPGGTGGGAAAEAPTGRPLHPLLAYLAEQDPSGGEAARVSAGTPERALSQHFSDADYRTRYGDVAEAARSPLLHYLRHGWREGRRPHPDFDPALFGKLADLDRDAEPYGRFLVWLEGGADRPAAGASVAETPAVSVIVLNHGKSLLTLQCLCVLAANTDMAEVEVVIVDNGSGPEDFARLARYARSTTLVRLGTNRGFGEGNNLGAERARGRLLVFLNNDTFVRPGWLAPLRTAIEGDPGVGAACAKLLYPDGRLQEAGAMISACGTSLQRGRGLDPRARAFNRPEAVDYGSAAALMVRADAFRAALGFDLAWDPAYYEDADLCLKLRALGLATMYVPTSEVVHLEHATSADAGLDLRLHDIVATNRLKFIARWGDHLAGLPGAAPPVIAAPVAAPAVPASPGTRPPRTLALYTPYPLTPGGGERYLLTLAASLRDDYRCVLLTPDRYSRLRILTIGRELGLDLAHVETMTLAEAQSGAAGAIDLFVCMANEVLPPVRGLGLVNLYHCQFPFPMAAEHYGRGWDHLAGYRAVVVNSAFTARHYAATAAALGLTPPPVRVLAPPVPRLAAGTRGLDGVRRILSVGRFAPGGHCKRQDLMIPAFEALLDEVAGPVELHLAGAVPGEGAARAYMQGIVEAARGLPVTFHPNVPAEVIAALYGRVDVYWHLTGAGEDVTRHPERFEHFGIALAEAMGAGAVPVALGAGGPAEIITDGRDGVLIADADDLTSATVQLLADPKRLARLSAAAQARAAAFGPDAFAAGVRAIAAEFGADLDGAEAPGPGVARHA